MFPVGIVKMEKVVFVKTFVTQTARFVFTTLLTQLFIAGFDIQKNIPIVCDHVR